MRWTTTRPWDLAAALAAVLLLDAAVALGVEGPLRVLVALPAFLVAPGWLLAAALFPRRHHVTEVAAGEPGEEETRRSEEGPGALERAALAVGLSIAALPLLGLALNATPWGVRLGPVLAALTLVSLAAGGAAAWRRARLPPAERFALDVELRPPAWRAHGALDKALAAGLALSVLAAGGALLYALAAPRGEAFTEFYVLGPGGQAAGYPTSLTVGEEARVRLGVVNREGAPAAYALRVVAEPGRVTNASGSPTFEPAGPGALLSSRNVTLEADARWEEDATFRLGSPGEHRVRFELDKPEGSDPPYRQVHLLVTVRG